jgi:integrase
MDRMGLHGEGGVTARRDGRLQVSLTMPNGRRAYRMIPAMKDAKRQHRLAQDALARLITAREADLDPAGQTVAVYLRSWLSDMAGAANARIRPNTLTFYRIVVERHVIPVLGGYKLERLSERHVQAWLDGLRMSPQYVHHCRAVLRRALNIAVRQRIIARNPALGVELPKVPRFRAAPMTLAETHALLEIAEHDRLAAFWRLAVITGLRVGEILGLGWEDVDLRAGTITVRARLARENGAWVRVPPKAARDLEVLAIDAKTTAWLEAHRLRQAAERRPDWPYWGLVFTSPTGQPLDRHRIMEAFRDLCDRASIARRRIHDIRHSNSTQMRELAIPPEVRKARHGHSTDEMDARYSQPSATQDRLAVERHAEAIG